MLCFAWVAACNIIGSIRATKEHGYSMAPLVGGFCCFLGLMAIPKPISTRWFLLAFIDPGTSIIIWGIPALIWLIIKTPKKQD